MATHDIMVNTSLGRIRGTTDKGVLSWKGIPYGAPLDGYRRFAEPEPIRAWNGILDATHFSGICPQRSVLRTKVSKGCLTLNIWSPNTNGMKRPVLFFIHGGSFKHGAGNEAYYHGSYLARTRNIVVVTCNYRLGVFGFLDFGFLDARFTTNNGVRDVLEALCWVNSHIMDFGGDPDCVTIVGQSAGGTMISALVSNNGDDTLFHRAIMMSGGPTQIQSKETCRVASEAFLSMGNIHSSQELLSLDLDDLISRQKRFVHNFGMGAATFRITVDGGIVRDFPIRAAMNGRITIPMLVGTTKEEMGFMAIRPLAKFLDVGRIVANGLDLESESMRRRLFSTYDTLYGTDRGVAMMYTDLLFRIASLWFSQAVGMRGNAWMYRFDYETRALRMNGLHAIHSSDIPYVFGNFSPVLVRPMFLLTGDMGPVHAVSDELQDDIVGFMREGTLAWEPVSPTCVMGKCYGQPASIQPMIVPELHDLYAETDYRRRSISGAAV